MTVYDPQAMDNSRLVFPALAYATTVLEACDGADVVLVLTEWSQFVQLDPRSVGEVTRGHTVIDGRHCLPRRQWEAAGWRYCT